MSDQYKHLPALKISINQNIEDQRKERMREILKQTLATRIRTSFIFALAEFERQFGYLWGHDVEDKSKLTEEQLVYFQMYKDLRKAIFDNGNAQIRAMSEEMNGYEVNWIQNTIVMKSLRKDQ